MLHWNAAGEKAATAALKDTHISFFAKIANEIAVGDSSYAIKVICSTYGAFQQPQRNKYRRFAITQPVNR